MAAPHMNADFAETSTEYETRRAEGFHEVEPDLPQHIGSRLNIPFLDNVSSFLGEHNVLAQEVNPAEDRVWLLDNTAYRPVHNDSTDPGLWEAEFVAAYFAAHSGKDVSEWVAAIADRIGLGSQGKSRAEGEAMIAKRLGPFVRTIRPARFVNVKFPNGEMQKLGPGGRNAISSQIIGSTGHHREGETLEIQAVPPEVAPHGSMLTHFAEPEGWTVISGRPLGMAAYFNEADRPFRYRRFHQDHHDGIPHRNFTQHFRLNTYTNQRHARTLRSYKQPPLT